MYYELLLYFWIQNYSWTNDAWNRNLRPTICIWHTSVTCGWLPDCRNLCEQLLEKEMSGQGCPWFGKRGSECQGRICNGPQRNLGGAISLYFTVMETLWVYVFKTQKCTPSEWTLLIINYTLKRSFHWL